MVQRSFTDVLHPVFITTAAPTLGTPVALEESAFGWRIPGRTCGGRISWWCGGHRARSLQRYFVVGTRAFSSSSTVLASSVLNFDSAVRDPHRVRRDALLSRWALDLAIGYAEAGPVPRAGHDVVFERAV